MKKLKKEECSRLAPLFEGWQESLIWSVLQGCMGEAWTDHIEHPSWGRLRIGDFCFFAGEPQEEAVRDEKEPYLKEMLILVPQHEGWERCIEKVYGKENRIKPCIRYAIKKEPEVFEPKRLLTLAEQLPKGYEIRMIDEALYREILKLDWACDFCSNFQDYEEFQLHGLGAVALFQGEIVSGASSYTYYQGGIEVEIDTKPEHRRKGLALACAAALILKCLEKGLYPSWDAQNQASVAIAEKLGYHFDKEYKVYEAYRKK